MEEWNENQIPLRQQLLELLRVKSFWYRPEYFFLLASGQRSPYYIDCQFTSYHGRGMALIGEICFDRIRNLHADAIGGLTMGADPIAFATALTSFGKGQPLNVFSVRQTLREHGLGGVMIGDVAAGDRVVVVGNVVTTGGSVLKAVKAARHYGLQVVKVLILVDCQEGGLEAVARKVPDVEAVFTIADLKGEAK